MPTSEKRNFAKHLRKKQTEAEKLLWSELRSRRFHTLKFRRQVPLGEYVVDFLCPQLRFIIEVDGPTHIGRETYDKDRTDTLKADGYHVWRISNEDVYDDVPGVLDAIFEAMVAVGLLNR